MQTNINKIVVTGAAGNLGSAVANELARRHFRVLAASTDPKKLKPAENQQPVLLNYVDAASVVTALKSTDGLLLIAPPLDPEAPSKLNPVIDQAKAAGLSHIVFISALGVDANEQAPLRQIERYLMSSGINYTILRPNFFMENFTRGFISPMIAQGSIFLAAADAKTSFISTQDIAKVAATAFEKQLFGQTCNLTGPEALDHYSVARIISDYSRKQVVYHAISESEMLQGARQNGLPETYAQYLAVLYMVVRNGWAAGITDDFRKVTGSKPISFTEFASQHGHVWK